jgi:hypothetical protein
MTPAAILQEYKQSLAALTKQHALMLEHLKQQYHFLRSLPSNQPSGLVELLIALALSDLVRALFIICYSSRKFSSRD